jgi:muramoyltetrapeptide carboxypeptidase
LETFKVNSSVPPFLKTGNTIGIVSTARKVTLDAVHPVKRKLEARGYNVVLGHTIGASWHQFAGDDQTRVNDFQRMLDSPEIHAILTAKGGYGTIRLLDKLDWIDFKKQPKWLAGFSDVTVLHAYLNGRLGVPSIHSPLAQLPDHKPERWQAFETLFSALAGTVKKVTSSAHSYNQKGRGEGQVTGGNLSILYSLLGSPESFDPTGKILLLEEVDEYLYHVDRMLWSLRRAGKLDGLAGIVIGGMTEMKDNEDPFGGSAESIMKTHFQAFSGPIAFGFPVGHIPFNHACYLGVKAKLIVDDDGAALNYDL